MKSKKRVAEQQAPVEYREDYDEKLVQLNRRLADTRTEHRRAGDALDDGEADYVGTKERRDMVLGENGRLISECQKSVDGLVVDKQRLVAGVNSYWAMVDALYESRVVQFERMLTRLKEDADFVRTRFDTSTQRIENRATMMDKLTRALENASNLKKMQQEGMYTNRQILACSMYNYTEELERYIGNFFETVLIDRSDKRNRETMQNIKEYNKLVKQFYKYRRNYIPASKDHRLIMMNIHQSIIINKLKIQQMMEKILRKKNIVPEKPYEVVHLHQEHSNYKIVPQRENSKHEPLVELDPLRSVIEQKIKLVEEITQQDITENESREWKCSYLNKLLDEIRTVVDKVKQYVIDEGQSTSYDTTDFEWLLNKGAVGHLATSKTASIQTYDYDVELNINQPYTECNRNNLQM
ncbi:uncharacterized protein LOC100569220 [Acyrthosiphon pisum]|uniref:Uncharacterized protein n=1 Tax=Acyrthosiphon pisum TaxID=7029 RepID=A0A8R1W5I0_ACYPI|nr:uncharacterized protein LOC100569220 [Acyrthosiphon pisum]|eukprot:XP_003242808.1 PREDICTED: uncharacterized protein LOC100569220 [Acyrthosiphon pisum]